MTKWRRPKYENPNRNEVKLVLDVWGVGGLFIVIFAGRFFFFFVIFAYVDDNDGNDGGGGWL